ncbi:hypothetical protein VP455E521_P0030 [Vibrio phage 455E52-1]|nr:hypothetical protein VP455E521_P0030 [Vibrio phage 455E52-1]CAH9015974.1 hypothetical protein VP120E341_P0029 [Vibrio phage 120E34-1]
MKVELVVECKKVGDIEPWSAHRVDVTMVDADVDTVIESIGLKQLLNHIGEDSLISHLEDRGFKITDEQ